MINIDSCLVSFSYSCPDHIRMAARSIFALNDNGQPVYYSNAALAELAEAGVWPNFRSVYDALESTGVDDLDPREVVTSLNHLIERGCTFEEAFYCDISSDDVYDFSLSPDIQSIGLHSSIRNAFKKDILDVTRFSLHGHIDAAVFGLITKDGGSIEYNIGYRYLNEEAQVVGVEVEGAIRLSLRDFIDGLEDFHDVDSLDAWRQADNGLDVQNAIEMALKESGLNEGVSVVIGQGFWESLRRCQACKHGRFSSVTLKTIVKAVSEIQEGTAEPFWTDTRRVAVRTDQGYFAYRFHISEAKEALRLMVWLKDNEIVLANVGPKKEEVIVPVKKCLL